MHGISLNSRLSLLTFAFFSFKMSMDSYTIKTYILKLITDRDAAQYDWLQVLEHLPIGLLVTEDRNILKSNEKFMKILGLK